MRSLRLPRPRLPGLHLRPLRPLALLLLLPLLGACASLVEDDALPTDPPPLVDMHEPLDLVPEPDDEAARTVLPLGGFTGVYVASARRTLEGDGASEGIRVTRVVENSPADAAGVAEDDLILAAGRTSDALLDLAWPSEWEQIEREATAGSDLVVLLDRAGREVETTLRVVQRIRAPGRQAVERYREEDRVGVVLRSATEVEARAAGLGAGGGAVIVGLANASPWRQAGLVYGDLLTSVGEQSVAHPQVLLDAIRDAPKGATLALVGLRDGAALSIDAPLSRRAQQVREIGIPFLYSYREDRGETEWSAIVGLISSRSTRAAWELTLLWFLSFSGGDADELVVEEQ